MESLNYSFDFSFLLSPFILSLLTLELSVMCTSCFFSVSGFLTLLFLFLIILTVELEVGNSDAQELSIQLGMF